MSVKVAVRVRPFNEREINMNAVCCVKMQNEQTVIWNTQAEGELAQKTFTFDYSFWSHDGFAPDSNGISVPDGNASHYADQGLVYDKLGVEVLDNAWQGYHCCLFAYGQTGSGKSYSMIGLGQNEGIVPQVCNEIFNRIQNNKESNVRFEVQFSMLEIYNERVQDLLQKGERSAGGLKVRENKGGVYVQDLTHHAVDSYERIASKMEEGYTSRSIGATKMNQTSSRAHTIITIEFKQIREEEGRKLEKFSVIHLVDLAGSEKAGQTGAEGQRFKEGCAINKSLSVLGNCISVLADKASGKQKNAVVPYRQSNLTRILQNSLGGNSKTIMICAISPASVSYDESLSTLRYADRAKQIINKAVVNESSQDKLIRSLKDENDRLMNMLQDSQEGSTPGQSQVDQELMQHEIKRAMEEADRKIADIEMAWEEKLRLQLEKDEAQKKMQEENEKQVQLKNKKAPHLTNLNEDIQLSGKLYYGLSEITQTEYTIGRSSDKNVVLRGVGIQENHASFKADHLGNISLVVRGQAAQEHTLVNGKNLSSSKDNFRSMKMDGEDPMTSQKFQVQLNHLDRICLGINTVFLFRYPLLRFKKEQLISQLSMENPNVDPEEIDIMVERKLEQDGLIGADSGLTCDEYPEAQIQQDDLALNDCFDFAMQEALQAEQEKQQSILQGQQKTFESEKKKIEDGFKQSFLNMKKQEEQKVETLKKEQEELHKNLIKREEEMKLMEFVQQKQNQEQIRQLEEQNKNKVDKVEVLKLQEQLERVQKQIKWQKEVNNKILKEQAERMMQQMKEQRELLETKQRMNTQRSQQSVQSIKFVELSRKIKEAQEICKMLKLNIKFSLLQIKKFDSMNSFRSSTTSRLSSESQLQGESRIQVQNFDKGGAIAIWTEQQLDDKIAMMRDGLGALEQQKQINEELKYKHDTPYNKEAFASEIFENSNMMDDASFDDDFMGKIAQNIDTSFMTSKEDTKLKRAISMIQPEDCNSMRTAKKRPSQLGVAGVVLQMEEQPSPSLKEQILSMSREEKKEQQPSPSLKQQIIDMGSLEIVQEVPQSKVHQVHNSQEPLPVEENEMIDDDEAEISAVEKSNFRTHISERNNFFDHYVQSMPEDNVSYQDYSEFSQKLQIEQNLALVTPDDGKSMHEQRSTYMQIPQQEKKVESPSEWFFSHNPSQINDEVSKFQSVNDSSLSYSIQNGEMDPAVLILLQAQKEAAQKQVIPVVQLQWQEPIVPPQMQVVQPAQPPQNPVKDSSTRRMTWAPVVQQRPQPQPEQQSKRRQSIVFKTDPHFKLLLGENSGLLKQQEKPKEQLKPAQNESAYQTTNLSNISLREAQGMKAQMNQTQIPSQQPAFVPQMAQTFPTQFNNQSIQIFQSSIAQSQNRSYVHAQPLAAAKTTNNSQSVDFFNFGQYADTNAKTTVNKPSVGLQKAQQIPVPQAVNQSVAQESSFDFGSDFSHLSIQKQGIASPPQKLPSQFQEQKAVINLLGVDQKQPQIAREPQSPSPDSDKEFWEEVSKMDDSQFADQMNEVIKRIDSNSQQERNDRARTSIQPQQQQQQPIQKSEQIPRNLQPEKSQDMKLVDKNFQVRQAFLFDLLSHSTQQKVLKEMFMLPIPPQVGYIQCTVERDNSGVKALFPIYRLKLTQGNKILMTGDKIANSASPHYKITLGQSKGDSPDQYIGRLRSNFKSTNFYVYGEGANPKRQTAMKARRQYGTILYSDGGVKEGKESRFFEAYMPMLRPKAITSWSDVEDRKKENIREEFKEQQILEQASRQSVEVRSGKEHAYRSDCIKFVSKTDFASLDFQGRVSDKSRKNFQLSDALNSDKVFLQFGRAGPNSFNMDVAYPFSLYQAFAVCLTTFERKW